MIFSSNLKASPGLSPARTLGLYCVNTVVVPARTEMMVRVQTDPGFNQYGLFTTNHSPVPSGPAWSQSHLPAFAHS